MFWDGRIEVSSDSTNKYQTNLDKELPEGFENLMAAQAIFSMIGHMMKCWVNLKRCFLK